MTLFQRFFITAFIMAIPSSVIAETGARDTADIVVTSADSSDLIEFAAAQNLMMQGQYQQAHDLAEGLGTAEGYALASEALTRGVILGEFDKLKKTSKRARKQAEKALELDPDLQKARLQYVITDGLVARNTGEVSAWMKKLPQKSFGKIEAYRSDFPEDVRGDALLGAWHLSIARKAGAKNAQDWFGANVAEGQKHYDKAVMETPNDPVILLNYAFSLLALDAVDFNEKEKISTLLRQCAAIKATDDLEEKLKARAEMALSIMKQETEVKTYAERYLDGEPVQ